MACRGVLNSHGRTLEGVLVVSNACLRVGQDIECGFLFIVHVVDIALIGTAYRHGNMQPLPSCTCPEQLKLGKLQVANMATDILGYQRKLSEAERAAQPHVLHLRSLHTDPAVAKEFLQLRDENKRLQDEKLKLRSTVEGLQFKVGDQVCAPSFASGGNCCTLQSFARPVMQQRVV